MTGERRGTSPWVYVGVGCGCLFLVGVVAVVAGFGWVFSEMKGIAKDLEDPEQRAARTREILGYETLPEGYVPTLGLSIPFIADVAFLSDQELDADGELAGPVQRALFYLRLKGLAMRDKDFQDLLEGRADPSDLLAKSDLRLRRGDFVGEGSVTVHGEEVRYSAHRGELSFQGEGIDGLVALFVVKCSGRQRPGIGGWLMPDPDPDAEPDAVDFTGTPADPAALTAFLSNFTLCTE